MHANQTNLTNGHGGLIAVKSIGDDVTASGHAVQASSAPNGSSGGKITVEAKKNVNLAGGQLEAAGAVAGGGAQHGGKIDVRAFNGNLGSDSASTLDVTGRTPPDGIVTLVACATTIGFPPGTVAPNPGATVKKTTSTCGGAPLLPLEVVSGDGQSYVILPPCLCAQACTQAVVFLHGPDTFGLGITGTGLSTVDAVFASPDCNTANGVLMPITAQSNTNIVVDTSKVNPGFYHILLRIPGVGTTCSQGTVALP